MNKLKQEKKEKKKKDKDWSLAVRARDEHSCCVCHIKKGEEYTDAKGKKKKAVIEAAHIIPREVKRFRWDIMNGLALCSTHHKWSLEISPHRNPFAFMIWLIQNKNKQYNYLEYAISKRE